MGKMNKILTNQPVELTNEEVANLSKTLSAVRTAGGGTSGKVYTGINGVSVDNTSDTVGLSVEMQNVIAGKLDSSDAATTYAPISAATAVDVLAPASGNWNAAFAVLTQYSAAGQWLTEHQSLANYYTKSQTSGADEIGNALNGKQNELSFTYDSSGCITHINSSAIAGEGGGGTIVYNGIDGVYVDGNNIGLSASYSAAIEDVSGKVDKPKGSSLANKLLAYQTSGATSGWLELVIPGAVAITAESGISADGYKIGLVPSAASALNDVAGKVNKPTALVDKYLVLRTDTNGDVSGWCDFQDQSYSKSEANGTFVATANIDTTTLSGDGKSVSTKLGVKTDVIATKEYVNSSFLPTSGGTVSGKTTISGNAFDTLELKRGGENTSASTGQIGINGAGGLSFKAINSNDNTQLNIAPNATMDKRFSIGADVYNPSAYFIPAVTATSTDGLTNDGILHIILES